ncbi:olfactory receptor 13F1-like [Bombina bombina]|uniref:olfactory receptor 13F1-like n=1 Tax=Bombina bombina TaxID=8345 RepID=UPI00235AF706|nr:olfactory receptor 13F1-like [Bombina bombina]
MPSWKEAKRQQRIPGERENSPAENATYSILLGEFRLMAFFIYVDLQIFIIIIVFLFYLLCVLGNLLITTLVCAVSQLHTPMYFFLCNLAIQDIVYVSAFLPKLLVLTITGDSRISSIGCVTQMFLYGFCIDTEFFLLTSMAYDRFVAICIPLRYSIIMNQRTCALLAFFSWLAGALNSLMFSLQMTKLSFCNVQEINHFFCDLPTMMKLSCSDTTSIRIFVTADGILLGWFPFIMILTSYIHIILTILKIRSTAGRMKTFSSCSSHLMVVIIFCGSVLCLNMKPESEKSQELDKLLSILYIGVVPMVNPLVYSLRNREVLEAIKIVFKRYLKCSML